MKCSTQESGWTASQQDRLTLKILHKHAPSVAKNNAVTYGQSVALPGSALATCPLRNLRRMRLELRKIQSEGHGWGSQGDMGQPGGKGVVVIDLRQASWVSACES